MPLFAPFVMLLATAVVALPAAAVEVDTSLDRVDTPLALFRPRLGTVRPKTSREIKSSNWMVGCETLDRDFADFNEYKRFLSPLGVKMVRLQGGWRKCEPEKGKYDFRWLDEIIGFLREQGIEVYLELSYGNPLYQGGGGWDLAGGFPSGPEGFDIGWANWVDAMTKRYGDQVAVWAIWNEPDIMDPAAPDAKSKRSPQGIADFNVRTAKLIRRNLPAAKIAGLSLARNSPQFLEDCLKAMGEDVKLLDYIVYHGYADRPEKSYANVLEQMAIVQKYNPAAELLQGENGCPSEMVRKFALPMIPWSEYSQAKWDIRRMLGDFVHGVKGNVFTACDFNHIGREINNKGLIRANAEHKVIGLKRAYYAVQNVLSVFDGAFALYRGEPTVKTDYLDLCLYELRHTSGSPAYLFWDGTKMPGGNFETTPAKFELNGVAFKKPVWVDLLTGRVHAVLLNEVQVYDSPCLLAERDAIDFVPVPEAKRR